MDPKSFQYDVFLSHSSKDKEVVEKVAQMLVADGLTVWFDKWEVKPGDVIPYKLENGLEKSRVLVLFLSANAYMSDWAGLEAGMFRFRDPLNKGRRFIPVRLDNASIPGSLAQVMYVDWRSGAQGENYSQLFNACRPPAQPETPQKKSLRRIQSSNTQTIEFRAAINGLAFSSSSRYLVMNEGKSLTLLDLKMKTLSPLVQRDDRIEAFDWTENLGMLSEGTQYLGIRVQGSAISTSVFEGHSARVTKLLNIGNTGVLSASDDGTVRFSSLTDRMASRVLRGHKGPVLTVAEKSGIVFSGSDDKTLRMWRLATGKCLKVFEGHTKEILVVAISPDGSAVLTGARDASIRLWDIAQGACLRTFEGHTDAVHAVAWSPDGRFFASGSGDLTVKLFSTETGACVATLDGHQTDVRAVHWENDAFLYSADSLSVRRWDVADAVRASPSEPRTATSDGVAEDRVLYTNAKVLLVGESGAGKTGLSKRLAFDEWELSASTVGAWATQWKVPVATTHLVDREIWLWDFGGQADQRLIHHLYLNGTYFRR